MKFTTSIPIKPHLKKYLIKRFGINKDYINVNKRSMIGQLIIKSFAERKNKPKKNDKFTDKITIVFDHKYDLTLSAGNVFDFNRIIDEIYRSELGMFIGLNYLFNEYPERKQAILNFNDKFNINEDDIPLDTLIKYIQRNPQDTKIFNIQ